MTFEMEMLAQIRVAIEEHEAGCSGNHRAILLNPANFELLGWDEALGLPLLPEDGVPLMRAQLLCGDEGWAGRYLGRRIFWTRGVVYEEAEERAV